MDFKSFIRTVCLDSKQAIKDLCLHSIDTRECLICAKTDDKTTGIMGRYRLSPLIKGDYGIANTEVFQQYLDKIGENISIKDNRLIFKGNNRRGSLLLKDPQFIESTLTIDDFNKIRDTITKDNSCSVEFDCSVFRNLIDDNNITKSSIITIELNNKKLTFTSGDENSDHITEEIEVNSDKKYTIKMGRIFLNAIRNLIGTITLTLGDSPCIMIEKIDDNTNIQIIIARMN